MDGVLHLFAIVLECICLCMTYQETRWLGSWKCLIPEELLNSEHLDSVLRKLMRDLNLGDAQAVSSDGYGDKLALALFDGNTPSKF